VTSRKESKGKEKKSQRRIRWEKNLGARNREEGEGKRSVKVQSLFLRGEKKKLRFVLLAARGGGKRGKVKIPEKVKEKMYNGKLNSASRETSWERERVRHH